MGLLDNFDDPKTQALLAMGFGLLNSRGSFGQGLGQAGQQSMATYTDARRQQQQRAMQAQQMEAQQQQLQMQRAAMEQQQAQAQRQMQADTARGGYLNSIDPSAGPAQQFNPITAMRVGGLNSSEIAQLSPQAGPKPLIVGNTVLDPTTMRPLYREPEKADKPPTSVQEFLYSQQNPEFGQWDLSRKKAGATNIGMPKIEVKMGESVAGQIGPMAKDSRIQAQGAVGMFDSADRIQRALDSGKASAGPFTTQIQTVKQLVQKVGGGSDEGIRQTRQVIKGLSQMSVEARKELQGQGQVTESEAAAVAKAESGDINDLTTGELQDLVTLTKRAAHMRAKSHQSIIDSMSGSDATKGMVPFYQVNNIDRLLKHSPQLPKIGGGSAVDDALKMYGGK